MSNYQKPKFIGDKESATYRWELYLENGRIFDGYSKNLGHAEKQDKEALFQDCIGRLGSNGYFLKCYQMLFFKREFLQHKSQDTLLLECFPEHYKAHNELNFQLPTLEFLNRVYARILNGDAPDFKNLLPEPPAFRSQEKDDFEFTKARFPTIEHVVTYCAEYLLREKQYGRSRVEGWYHKVKHYYRDQPLPTSSPIVRPASANLSTPILTPGAAPHKAAAQVMQATNMLMNKHQSSR